MKKEIENKIKVTHERQNELDLMIEKVSQDALFEVKCVCWKNC